MSQNQNQNQDLEHDIDDYNYAADTTAPATSGKSKTDKYIIFGAIAIGLIFIIFMYMSKRGGGTNDVATDVSPEQVQTSNDAPPAPTAEQLANSQFQQMPPPVGQATQMIEVPVTMPKLTDPVSGVVKIKDVNGLEVEAYSYEGQQVISQFIATNSLQPVYVANMAAPLNPNSQMGQMNQASVIQTQELQRLESENSQLKAQNNSLRDVAQRQHITIGQLQLLIKNTRANQGANVVTLRQTKSGVAVGKALPVGQEIIATVGNRVWLSDGKKTASYAVGDRLPTGYRVLDVNETAGQASFTK